MKIKSITLFLGEKHSFFEIGQNVISGGTKTDIKVKNILILKEKHVVIIFSNKEKLVYYNVPFSVKYIK